jgi:hypothetical protein
MCLYYIELALMKKQSSLSKLKFEYVSKETLMQKRVSYLAIILYSFLSPMSNVDKFPLSKLSFLDFSQ